MAFMFETRFVWRPTRAGARIGAAAARVLPLLAGPAEALRPEQAMSTIDDTHDPRLRELGRVGERPGAATSRSRTCRSAASAAPATSGLAHRRGDRRPGARPARRRPDRHRRHEPADGGWRPRRARRCVGAICDGLREGSARQKPVPRGAGAAGATSTMGLPCRIGDYTDFYTSIHHATTVGKLFRPDNPLLPNYKWVPIGYHGRASSIGVSGRAVPRGRRADASRRTRDARAVGPTPAARLRARARRRSSAGRTRWASRSPIARGRGRTCSA